MFSEEKKLSVLAVSKQYIEEFTENNTWQSFVRSVLGAWYTTIWKFGLVRFLMFWKFYTYTYSFCIIEYVMNKNTLNLDNLTLNHLFDWKYSKLK